MFTRLDFRHCSQPDGLGHVQSAIHRADGVASNHPQPRSLAENAIALRQAVGLNFEAHVSLWRPAVGRALNLRGGKLQWRRIRSVGGFIGANVRPDKMRLGLCAGTDRGQKCGQQHCEMQKKTSFFRQTQCEIIIHRRIED